MNARAAGNGTAPRAWWIAAITAITMIGSSVFACATPFPALGALAALYMTRRDATLLIGVNWAANQLIGYGILRYPTTWDSLAWGGAIGLAALIAVCVAIGTEQLARGRGALIAALASLIAAAAAYEVSLFAATAFLPSGPDAFGFGIVSYIVAVNAVAFAGYLGLRALGHAAGFALPRRDAVAEAA